MAVTLQVPIDVAVSVEPVIEQPVAVAPVPVMAYVIAPVPFPPLTERVAPGPYTFESVEVFERADCAARVTVIVNSELAEVKSP